MYWFFISYGYCINAVESNTEMKQEEIIERIVLAMNCGKFYMASQLAGELEDVATKEGWFTEITEAMERRRDAVPRCGREATARHRKFTSQE